MRLRSSITPFLVVLFLYGGVLACQCVDPYRTPYEDFDDSAVVFAGTVRGFRDKVIDAPNGFVERSFQFEVDETLKGDHRKSRDVITGITRDICYVDFGKVGTKYIVYTYQQSGELHTSLFCSRRSIAPDLHFLRRKLRKIKEPRIYGMIDRERLGRSKQWPVSIQVVAESTGKKLLTKADKSGRFSFDNLPDGFYLVSIATPNSRRETSGQEFRVRLGDPLQFDDLGSAKKSAFLTFPLQ